MIVSTKTDIGSVRSSNEDSYVYLEKKDGDFIAFVCDGMGGHLGGSFASSKTIEVLSESFKTMKEPIKNVGVWLFEVLQRANTMIYEKSMNDENLRGMGTTVSGVLQYHGEIYYAHIGDSRIYSYQEQDIQQLTTDHTYVNSLLLNGLITYKQALKHPKRHVLTNALGIKKDVSVDIGVVRLKKGENLLICSDGLHNMLDNRKLLKILGNQTLSAEEKNEQLIEKALQQGGSDNITSILLEKIR